MIEVPPAFHGREALVQLRVRFADFPYRQRRFSMSIYTQGHSRLISTGVYLPPQRITSTDIMREIDSVNRFGLPLEWLERLTGIKEKRVADSGLAPSDMAVAAAKEALDRAQLRPTDIDAVIYAGLTHDFTEPATAHLVQAKLGATNAIAFDVTNACHGFMNGVHLMDALIASGQARHGLVVCGEQGSLFTEKAVRVLNDTHDRETLGKLAAGLTLGDAGAAMILGPKLAPDLGFLGFMLRSEGQFSHFCTAGGPLQEGPLVTDMPKIVGESLKLIGAMYTDLMQNHLHWDTAQLALYVAHQVSGPGLKRHSETTGVPLSVMSKTVFDLGNIITATIPVNIHKACVDGGIRHGDKVYFCGAGSGVSVSQAGLVWDAA